MVELRLDAPPPLPSIVKADMFKNNEEIERV